MTTEDKVDFLEELQPYEGTELGEYWLSLCYIWRYSYCMSNKEFIRPVETEINLQYHDAIDLIKDDAIEIPEELRKRLI